MIYIKAIWKIKLARLPLKVRFVLSKYLSRDKRAS